LPAFHATLAKKIVSIKNSLRFKVLALSPMAFIVLVSIIKHTPIRSLIVSDLVATDTSLETQTFLSAIAIYKSQNESI